MKRNYFYAIVVSLLVGLLPQRAWAIYHYLTFDGISYLLDENGFTAKVIPNSAKNNNYWQIKDRIVIPEKVTWEGQKYTVTEIGANAFHYWLYASFYNEEPFYGTVSLPSTITAIGDNAFEESGIDKIILTCFTPPALGDNPSMSSRRLEVQAGTKSAYEAAEGWKNAKEITELPRKSKGFYYRLVNSVSGPLACIIADPIGNHYEELGEVIEIPKELYDPSDYTTYPVYMIDEGAFANNSVVNKVWMNDASYLQKIGKNAFNSCQNLTGLLFSFQLTDIGQGAFSFCPKIQNLYLYSASSLSSIGDRAFYGCSGLKQILTEQQTPLNINKDVFTGATNAVLTVPFGCKSAYQDIPGWAKLRIEEKQFVTVQVGDLYYEIDGRNHTASVTWDQSMVHKEDFNYASLTGAITIPSSITWKGESYPVTAIGDNAFLDARLTSVTIPSSVQIIDYSAFRGCKKMKTVKFSEGLKEIKGYAFQGCVSILEMIFPNTLESIGELAVRDCIHLHKIFIPKSVDKIGSEAFDGCNIVDTLITDRRDPIPLWYVDEKGVERKNLIGGFGLSYQESVLLVPSDCINAYYHKREEETALSFAYDGRVVGYPIKIGDLYYTFVNNQKYERYYFDATGYHDVYSYRYEATVTAESSDANNYASLRGAVTVPDVVSANGIEWKVVMIDRNAFKNAPLTSITIPQSVTTVGAESFKNAKNLTTVTLSSNADVGRSAFEGCTALTNVTLSPGMHWLYPSAFANCTALSDIYYMSQSPITIQSSCFEGVNQANVTLHVPYGAASNFSSADVWKNFQIDEANVQVGGIYYTLNETERTAVVTYSTKSYQSGNYSNLSGKVTIPASITYNGKEYEVAEVGYRAFYYVTGITEIVLPEGLKRIGTNAFYNCPNLAKANIPSTVTEIGSNPFYGTPIITGAAGNIIYLDQCAIGSKSANLSGTLTITDGTRVIGGSAFSGCKYITSLSLPASVVSIGESAFQGCTMLETVDLTKCVNLTLIAKQAFTNSKALTELTLPAALTEIGDYAFYNTGLTQIYVPDKVKRIGEDAFLSSKLQTVYLPSTIEQIGAEAFNGSAALKTLYLRGNNTSVISLGSDAFAGTAIASGRLVVPRGAKIAYQVATQWKDFGTITEAYANVDGLYYELNETDKTAALAPDQSNMEEAAGGKQMRRRSKGAGSDMIVSEYNQTMPSLVIPAQIFYEGENYVVTSVLPDAFYDCNNLGALVFSSKTAQVGNNAFDGTSIVHLELPENLKTLSNGVFANCDGLTKIRCRSAVPIDLSGVDVFSGLNPLDITLRVPYGSYAAYKAAPVWKDFNIEEENPCVGGLYYTLDRTAHTATVSPETDDETNYRLLYGTVNIPASIELEGETFEVVGIEPNAFANMRRVEDIFVRQEEPFDISGLNVFDNVEIGDMVLHVPYVGLEAYETADVWQEFMWVEPYEVQLTVEAEDPEKGYCTGSGIYEKNDSVLIEAIPAEGYRFAGWEGGTILTNPVKWKLNETDEFVTAMFEPKECIVKFIDWDGTLLFATSVTYGNGVETADIPTEREGWHFTGWGESTTQITDDTDFYAHYEPDTYDVTVAALNGTVLSTDIDGNSLDLQEIPYGTILCLQAVANESYLFQQWENEDKRELRIITVTSDMNLTATFEQDTDGIEDIDEAEAAQDNGPQAIYDLSGRKLHQLQRGINILRMNDGSTRKVRVK